MCACARLLMLDSIFQKLILSQFCIWASGKKKQKGKCSVYSTRAPPLLTDSCLMLKDHAAFKKEVFKVSLAEQRPAVWRRGTGNQKENLCMPEGCAPGLKALGKPCRGSAGTGGLRAIVPSLRGYKPALLKDFFLKTSLVPCKIHLLLQTASLQAHSPQLLLQQQILHLPLEEKYHLNILPSQTTDYLEKKAYEVLRLYWNPFTCFCYT